MNAFDAAGLARLARALAAEPRHVLVAAARVARLRETQPDATIDITAILRDARADVPFARGAGALLATPIASFAPDETDRALAVLWPAAAADA